MCINSEKLETAQFNLKLLEVRRDGLIKNNYSQESIEECYEEIDSTIDEINYYKDLLMERI